MDHTAPDAPDLTKRQLPRATCNLAVAYEIVEWDDFDLSGLQLPQWTTCHDLSAMGIGFASRLIIPDMIRSELNYGFKKMRLSISLTSASNPVLTFARLVWGCDQQTPRSGWHFMDIPEPHFHRLGSFVGQLLTPR